MSNPRFRAYYKNTTSLPGDPYDEWRVDICDTETVSQIINFEATKPTFNFEGLSNDLKPGIYTSSLKFGMFVRQAATNVFGTTYGPSESIITDLLGSNEGRFRVKLYKNDNLYFAGVILPDQCNYEDTYSPYLLNITAVDGLYRLGSEDYVSEVGKINYETVRSFSFGGSEYSSTPLAPPSGSEWVLIEHHSAGLPFGSSSRKSTYARYEQYSIASPGTGWVDQGDGLWAKEVDYFNEQIVTSGGNFYHLTRDIDNNSRRPLSEYIARAMAIIPTNDEYGTDIMYDCVNTWYETGMWSLSDDVYTQVRFDENVFAVGAKWRSVIETILTHFYSRLYYSNGRYHIEQISERGVATIDRHCYDKDGVFVTTESGTDLDLSYSDLGMSVSEGGSYKMLAALRSVKIKVKLSDSNLLAIEDWDLDHQGSRYLGRIKTTQTDTRFGVNIGFATKGVFNGISLIPGGFHVLLTTVNVFVDIKIRITNIETGITSYLTPVAPDQDEWGTPTWETTDTDGYFTMNVGIAGSEDFAQINSVFYASFLSEELPGSIGDSFDTYISLNFYYEFPNQYAIDYWTAHPDDYEITVNTVEEELLLKDASSNLVDAQVERVYETVNSLDNTVVVEYDAKFTDFGVGGEVIEVMRSASPESWGKSKLWNRFGIVSGAVELLTLLSQEIVSLRTVPLRVYSGGFMNTTVTTQNRINRESILYLPLSLSVDTNVDLASGEFVNIERAEPPGGDVFGIPYDDALPNPGVNTDINFGFGSDPVLLFETNEIITAASTLTEVDIVNSLGVSIAAGELVKIVHPTTGVYEIVELSADVEASDTVMYFNSYEFVNSYPDASLIILANEDVVPLFPGLPYFYHNLNYNLAYHQFPTYYTLPDPEVIAPALINKRIKVYRNSILTIYVAATGTLPDSYGQWTIDTATNRMIFPVQFNGEKIRIEAQPI